MYITRKKVRGTERVLYMDIDKKNSMHLLELLIFYFYKSIKSIFCQYTKKFMEKKLFTYQIKLNNYFKIRRVPVPMSKVQNVSPCPEFSRMPNLTLGYVSCRTLQTQV